MKTILLGDGLLHEVTHVVVGKITSIAGEHKGPFFAIACKPDTAYHLTPDQPEVREDSQATCIWCAAMLPTPRS